MTIEAIATGSTVEEAHEAALLQLGDAGENEVQFEIIDMPIKKKFGLFGGRPAKVRVFYEKADKQERRQKPAPRERAAKAKQRQGEVAASSDKSKQVKAAAEAAAAEQKSKKPTVGNADDAVKYLSDVLDKMGLKNLSVTTEEIEDGIKLNIEGEGLGVIIGRRGETLDALQYLCSLANNSDKSGYSRIVLDTNGYREKREQTLRALAERMARQSLETKRNQSLEPMNPYERRIIHTAVQEIEGVTSWSVTDSRGRRVIIGLENKEEALPERPRYNRNRRDGGHRRSSGRRPAPSAPTREVMKDAGDAPLYGRID